VQTEHLDPDETDVAEYVEPDWVRLAVDESLTWLKGSFTKFGTLSGYATNLGIPSAEQSWRPQKDHNFGRRSNDDVQQAFFRWCVSYGFNPFTDITEISFKAWLLFLREAGDSNGTARQRLGTVRSWYQMMRRRKLTTINPDDLLTRQERKNLGLTSKQPDKPTVALTIGQVRALGVAASCDPTDQRERNQAIVATLAATALRADELCGLDIPDLYRTGRHGVPEFYVHGKGSKKRWVRVPDAEMDAIDTYLPTRVAPDTTTEVAVLGQVSSRRSEQPLFTTASGKRLTPGGLTSLVRRLCKLLNPESADPVIRAAARELAPLAKTLHLHQFRHFAAQEAYRNGALITEIRDWLGHSSIEVTETYLGLGSDPARAPGVVVSGVVHAGMPQR
jgi:site-specific recombinase XerD